jgi:hypothetical protein
VHFSIAAGLLLAATVGWTAVIKGLDLYFAKQPVPPPAVVQTEDHRLTSFPKRIGPYVLAAGLFKDAPEGTTTVTEDVMGTLGMNKHKYNWYYMATFRDTRPNASEANRFLRLDVTYYTGLIDAMPHIGDVCIVASGGRVLDDQGGAVEVTVPGQAPPWNRFDVRRTVYEILPTEKNRLGEQSLSSQYHVFSVNGRPIEARDKARAVLADLRMKYCYYAKIQTATVFSQPDVAAADAANREFLSYMVPVALEYLPSEAEVERLNNVRHRDTERVRSAKCEVRSAKQGRRIAVSSATHYALRTMHSSKEMSDRHGQEE